MNIRIIETSKYSITLEWDAVASAFNYQIFYNEKGVGVEQQVGSTATQRVVTGLKPDTFYQFRVASVNNGVVGDTSGVVEGKTKTPVPNPPTNLQVLCLEVVKQEDVA